MVGAARPSVPKADALVTQAAVTQEVTQQRAVTERATIETNAQMLADKVINQREDIKRARSIVQRLWEIVDSDDSLVRASRNLTGQISNPAHELNRARRAELGDDDQVVALAQVVDSDGFQATAFIRHFRQWRECNPFLILDELRLLNKNHSKSLNKKVFTP